MSFSHRLSVPSLPVPHSLVLFLFLSLLPVYRFTYFLATRTPPVTPYHQPDICLEVEQSLLHTFSPLTPCSGIRTQTRLALLLVGLPGCLSVVTCARFTGMLCKGLQL